MKQYDPETLARLHKFTVRMLQDFITVCEKYNIPYFAVYGTTLGAVRHGGFIPWDDDLDVGMLRKDYERFMEIMPKELGDRYSFLNAEIDENYTCSVNHFGRKGTVFIAELSKHMQCEHNICFDIFVYDEVPEDEKLRKKQLRAGFIWSKLLYLKGTAYPLIPWKGIKRVIASVGCFLIHYALVLFRVKTKTIYQKMENNAKQYNGSETSTIACFQDSNIPTTLIRKDELFPLKTLPFEEIEIKVPGETDAYLTRIYGDYMQLPKEEDRRNHYPYRLDFGKVEEVEYASDH